MVLWVEVTNLTSAAKEYSVYSDLQTSLRTSHSYKLKSSAQSEYITQSYEDGSVSAVFTNFDDIETKYAQVFVLNAGEKPVSFSTESSLTDFRKDSPYYLINELKNKSSLPAAAFVYRKKIAPGEKLKIVQIIGSCRKDEREDIAEYLFHNYKAEVEGYEQYVLDEINTDLFLTGDPVLDKSIIWAKGILAVNQHYIDGSIQPMPCPAEYNFYFTHDVLLTDLAVVKFNPARVKRDLEFILEHSEDDIIPHAYYWKDSSYLTEYASPDNWNHFWFIILSAEYLRKSDDTAFLGLLYPCLVKSIGETMQNLKEDLIWAYQPDWWDIGSKWGPRAYMTILAIKALNDFSDISQVLGKNKDKLSGYSELAVKMQKALNEKLWNNDKKYLMNYFGDGSEDPHFYTGSLLAVHFNLLDKDKAVELTETASHYLLDEKIGIYNVYPMDFHKLTGFWEFAGNEAGDQFKYINGGVWPHGNAWYALALYGTGKKNEAVEFIKKTMTTEGIINSPNGQPAMYEYRNSNKNSSLEYGKVDKPQFMWAAGWYLYCIYEFFLIR